MDGCLGHAKYPCLQAVDKLSISAVVLAGVNAVFAEAAISSTSVGRL